MTSREGIVALPVRAIREIDRLAVEEIGMSSLVLMENAGHGVAYDLARSKPLPCSATILCGSGNNGGDGLVIARHLDYLGWGVRVWMLGREDRMSRDCLANWQILAKSDVPMHVWSRIPDAATRLMSDITSADVIIDAMLGTGQIGAPGEPYAMAINASNQANALRVAVDVPTGLDAETGESWKPVFQAARTYTFVAWKSGFLKGAAQEQLGDVLVCSIGAPRTLVHRFVSHG